MKTKTKYVFGTTWMEGAPCVSLTDLFYPDFDGNFTTQSEAKAICASCPFQARCLDYALYMGDSEGIFGGLTGRERARIRKEQNATWDTFIGGLSADLDAVAESLV